MNLINPKTISIAIKGLLGCIMCLSVFYAFSFKPADKRFGHTYITVNATKSSTFTISIDGIKHSFTEEAVAHLVDGVQAPDRNLYTDGTVYTNDSFTTETGGSYEINVPSENTAPEAHCDNEQVTECAVRISKLMRNRGGSKSLNSKSRKIK